MAWSTPKTWNVGDVSTAADFNTYVRDNENALYGTVYQLAVVSGTTSVWGGGYNTGTCVQMGQLVFASGTWSASVAIASSTVVLTMPAGVGKPATETIMSGNVMNVFARYDAMPAGTILFYGASNSGNNIPSGNYFTLDGHWTVGQ